MIFGLPNDAISGRF